MSLHILVKEVDATGLLMEPPTDPEYVYSIVCPEGNGCTGWVECDKPHEVDGVSADGGPYGWDDDAPWDGHGDFTFHGVSHQWMFGGWSVPMKGCPVKAGDWDPPDEARDLLPGEWPVEDDWDDEIVTLRLIEGGEA